jgi:hypothetical protein
LQYIREPVRVTRLVAARQHCLARNSLQLSLIALDKQTAHSFLGFHVAQPGQDGLRGGGDLRVPVPAGLDQR